MSFSTDDDDLKQCVVVFFDLETTGFSDKDEIVQIAASCLDKDFDMYIMPNRKMDEKASQVTGIKIFDHKMYYNDMEVTTMRGRDALISFLWYLKRFEKPCILVAHNCYR